MGERFDYISHFIIIYEYIFRASSTSFYFMEDRKSG